MLGTGDVLITDCVVTNVIGCQWKNFTRISWTFIKVLTPLILTKVGTLHVCLWVGSCLFAHVRACVCVCVRACVCVRVCVSVSVSDAVHALS